MAKNFHKLRHKSSVSVENCEKTLITFLNTVYSNTSMKIIMKDHSTTLTFLGEGDCFSCILIAFFILTKDV